jgi:hypothetical protein
VVEILLVVVFKQGYRMAEKVICIIEQVVVLKAKRFASQQKKDDR